MLRLAANAGSSAEDLLVRRLSAESTLLVLDNCEQVAAASAALVSVLVTRCPQLRVLTTSRISARVEWRAGVPRTADDGGGRRGQVRVRCGRAVRAEGPAGRSGGERGSRGPSHRRAL